MSAISQARLKYMSCEGNAPLGVQENSAEDTVRSLRYGKEAQVRLASLIRAEEIKTHASSPLSRETEKTAWAWKQRWDRLRPSVRPCTGGRMRCASLAPRRTLIFEPSTGSWIADQRAQGEACRAGRRVPFGRRRSAFDGSEGGWPLASLVLRPRGKG
jgi:hypothetical protein